MPEKLPQAVKELLEKPFLAHLATVMRDGSPQVTPLWVDTDGEYVYVNTAEGRVKARNLRRDARVALSVVDPQSPNRGAVQIRGRVVEITHEGANDHINKLAKKYTGKEYGFRDPTEVRLKIKILPEHLMGGVLPPPPATNR